MSPLDAIAEPFGGSPLDSFAEPIDESELPSIDELIEERPGEAMQMPNLTPNDRLRAAYSLHKKYSGVQTPFSAGEMVKKIPLGPGALFGYLRREGLPFYDADRGFNDSLRRFQEGKADTQDYHALARLTREQEAAGNRNFIESTFGGVLDTAGFAAEIAATGGLGRIASTATKGALAARGAPALVTRGGGALAGLGAQAGAITALHPSDIAERMGPQIQGVVDEDGQLGQIILKDGDGFLTAASKEYLDTLIEVGSEKSGALIDRGLARLIPQQVKQSLANVARKVLGSAPGSTSDDILKYIKEAGINSLPSEIAEERIGEVARGATGLEQNFGVTGQLASGDIQGALPQLAQEAAIMAPFSLAGAAANVQSGRDGPTLEDVLAQATPEALSRISAKQNPSRKDFADAGLPSVSANERAVIAEVIRQRQQPPPPTTVPEQSPVLSPEEITALQAGPRQDVTEQLPPVEIDEQGVTHQMPTGEAMPGPEHPGAVPGTTVEMPPAEPIPAPKPKRGFRKPQPQEIPDAGQVPGAETVIPQAGQVPQVGQEVGGQNLPVAEVPIGPAAAPQAAGVQEVPVKRGFRKVSLTESPDVLRITSGFSVGERGSAPFYPKKTISTLKKYLTSAGHLPQQVFDLKQRRDASISAEAQKIKFTTAALQDSLVKETGSNKLSGVGKERLNLALRGEADALADLPLTVQKQVVKMREHIDALSRRLIANGLAEGDLELTIEENMGAYVTRSYQVFDDPKWKDKVPADVRNTAHAWMRQEFPNETEEQIRNRIDDLLYKENAPLALIAGRKLGSKDLSITKKRKNVPPELRALMGEYSDPFVNYVRSVTKMSYLAANHEFLTLAKAAGEGKFFFERDAEDRPQGFNAQIAAEGSDVLRPLNGLMTTPEIKAAFEETFSKPISSGLLGQVYKWYMRATGLTKYAKTVLSPVTHVRNFLGNAETAIANGHWNVFEGRKALGPAKEFVRAELPEFVRRFVSSKEEAQKAVLRYVKLGLIGEDVHAGELREVLRDATDDMPAEVSNNLLIQAAKKGGGAISATYQLGDAVWKIYGFENERARYKAAYEKAGQPLTDKELDDKAAEVVRNTLPTYSMIPRLVKELRAAPLIAPFVSFPAEVVRTKFQTLKLTAKELADPIRRGIGAQRLAGLALSLTIPYALTALARFILGIGDEEDEDLRKFVPPWSKNSDILWLSREPGKAGWIDLSYTFPSNYYRDPIRALFSGDNWEDSFASATGEAFQPVIGEELLAEKLLDLARNTTKDGRPVYNPQDEPYDRLKQSSEHVWKAFEPGAVTSLQRNIKAWTGHVEQTGRSYDPGQEALSVLAGARVNETDFEQSLGFQARRYSENVEDATAIFRQEFGSRASTPTAQSVEDAYQRSNKARQSLFNELHASSQAAIRLGVEEKNVAAALIKGGIPESQVQFVIDGDYTPYEPSETLLERSLESPSAKQRFEGFQRAYQSAGGEGHMGKFSHEVVAGWGRISFLDEPLPASVPKDDREKYGFDLAVYRRDFLARKRESLKWLKESGVTRGDLVAAHKAITDDLTTTGKKTKHKQFFNSIAGYE